MRECRFPRFVAFVLATLVAPSLPAQPVREGILALDIAPAPPSSVGLDLGVLEVALCDGNDGRDPKLLAANDGTNRLAIGRPAGDRAGLELVVTVPEEERLGRPGVVVVELVPAAFTLPGDAVLEAACGTWRHRFELDAQKEPPLSSLTLVRSHAQRRGGVFFGDIEIPLVVVATRVDPPAERRLAFTALLALEGTWAVSPSRGRNSGHSNLVLFAQRVDGRWEPAATPLLQTTREFPYEGQLVVQASGEALAALNRPDR